MKDSPNKIIPTTGINWQTVHEQLKANQILLEKGNQPTTEEIKRILKLRAQTLAEEPVISDNSAPFFRLIQFRIASESYALELSYVDEVYQLKNLTPLPCTPSFVMGITNVRGQIISVIDVKTFFSLKDTGDTTRKTVIVLHDESMTFGVLADEILGVVRISASEIQASLPTLTGLRKEFLKGITLDGLIILDVQKLLTSEHIVVNEQV